MYLFRASNILSDMPNNWGSVHRPDFLEQGGDLLASAISIKANANPQRKSLRITFTCQVNDKISIP